MGANSRMITELTAERQIRGIRKILITSYDVKYQSLLSIAPSRRFENTLALGTDKIII